MPTMPIMPAQTIIHSAVFKVSGLLSVLFFWSLVTLSQGSWTPPDADERFPRTLLDTLQIDSVRSTLASAEILPIYNLVWDQANATIPAGNTTDGERFTRSAIAKEAAFVALMDRKPLGGGVGPLTGAERQQLMTRSQTLLEEINTAVGFQSGWIFYQEWQNRSKELINYLIAYDLLLGAGVSPSGLQQARDSLVAFTGHLYHRAMATYTVFIWQFQFFTFQFNNHSIMTASALGLAAVVLNDQESPDPDYQPQSWISAGLWNLDNTLWRENGIYPRVSEPGMIAGYAEGPAYFEYGFENAYPFIRALWNFLPDDTLVMTFGGETRGIRHPWYDPNYDSLYAWMIHTRMPDGSSPAIHDSPISFGTSITALSGKSAYNIPNPGYPPTDVMWRTQYISTMTPQGSGSGTLMVSLPDAGSLVFRSSATPDATYLHLIGKHGIPLSGAKAHHQGDATSFSLMANGELLAVDPGYPGYAESSVVNKATNHNLVLVNGTGPLPPIGEAVSLETNTCFIVNTFSVPFLDYGEILSGWFGADVTRKVLFVDHRYVVLADYLSSPSPASYTFQLHGNGLAGGTPGSPEGAFVANFGNQEGTWLRGSASLLVHTVASGGADNYAASVDSLATGTAQYRPYTKMLVSKENVTETGFLSALIPYTSNPLEVETLDAGEEVCALRIDNGFVHDLVFTQLGEALITLPASVTGIGTTIAGDGHLNVVETEEGSLLNPPFLFISEGTTLSVGGLIFITSPARKDIALYYEPRFINDIKGYVGDTGWVGIRTDFTASLYFPVSGAIDDHYGDDPNNLIYLHFTAPSYFIVQYMEGANEGIHQPGSLRIIPGTRDEYLVELTTHEPFQGRLQVHTVSGQLTASQSIAGSAGKNQYPLDLSGKASGVYIVSVTTTVGRESIKLIVNR